MNFPIEAAAAFLSRTVPTFPLSSTVQPSLDPLTVNDLWGSAVAVRPVQQQHETQVPFWPQLQGTEFWPQTGQPQQWSTPRSPLGLTGPPPTTLQGMSANDWQSPLPPPPTWGCKHSWFWLWRQRSTGCLVDWLECERKRIQGWCHAIHGILGSRSDTKVGLPGTRSTIETLVTRAQFLATRHQYSCEQTRCQIVQVIAPQNDWSEFGRSIFGGSNLFGSRI